MQGWSLGAGLAALAFWGFVAAVIVAGIWYSIREKESQHETVRRIVESGQPLDDATIDKLLALGGDRANRIDRNLWLAAVILLPAAVGLAIFGLILGAVYVEAKAPLLGAAVLAGCIGAGMMIASRIARRWYGADDGSRGSRV
jgi:hypothetical protein